MGISDQILILGNGGVKTTRTYEEGPKLMGYVVDLQAFDKALTEAQKKWNGAHREEYDNKHRKCDNYTEKIKT